jgi:alpha-1,2-mannosyltransferase
MNEITAQRGEVLQKGTATSDVVLAALSLILGLLGCLWLGPLCVEAMRPAPGRVNDFYQDWGSARNHSVGLPVYTHHATSIPRHLGLPFDSVTDVEYNAHPPTSVLLALPLARLDYPDAVLVWNAFSVVAFLASLVIVAAVLPVPRTLFLPALALLTFCHPLYGNLHQCQLTLFLVLLVTVIWALERSGRSRTAGLVLGAAVAIKLFPAYLVVYYLARRRYRALLAVAASFLALTLATTLVLGLDAYSDYVQVVLPAQVKFQSLGYNYAITGFWHKLFDPAGELGWMTPLWFKPALARWGTILSDLALTTIAATFAYRACSPAQRDLAFALVVTAMLLVSPVTWDTSLLLLLVPVAILARSAGTSRGMPAALVLILAVLWMPQIILTKLALGGRSLHAAPWTFMLGAPSLKFYALLAIFALGMVAFQAKATDGERQMTDGGPHDEYDKGTLG